MFYRQCNNCNERWELGTTNICTCVTNASATISYDKFSHLGQRTWVGLTEDEILLISADCAASHQHTDIHFARAIEAKLKEKNGL
jgi:hypothetical protein